jgi:hypothetical protein
MSSHLKIGSIVEAPEGHGEMAAGATYHYLYCDPKGSRVLLVRLIAATPPRSEVTIMSQAKFENGLELEAIFVHPTTPGQPPWLAPLEGLSIEKRQATRKKAKRDYQSYVDARVALLQPLVDRADEILSAANPLALVNQYARANGQNETRFRTWFLVYVLFGRNRWSLLPPFHRSGRWARSANPNAKKRGRPSKSAGKGSGHNMLPELARRIANSFKHRVQLGDTWTRVYGRSMREDFGAQTLTNGNKRMALFHPKGEPLPSPNQYRNWVVKAFGLDEVQVAMLGRTRVRNKLKAPLGNFSECISKLLQKTEADAYYTDDHPCGFIDADEPLPKLSVVRIRCTLSGVLAGIGMTCGPERSEAYRMALFCAAVPKSYFCSLFGLFINDDEWPCTGISPNWITDRGPGAKQYENDVASTRQVPASFSPRSKSNIESTNPHSKNLEGAPTYTLSSLTPVQMARREILQLIKDNKSMDMSGRMTPELIKAQVLPAPLHLWNYFASRGRTAAVSIAIEDAVRKFLTSTTLTLKKDGVWLGRLRFNSTELQQTGWPDRVRVGGNSTVTAYLLELCVSTIWVEVDGRLLQLNVQSPYLTDDEQYYMSMIEVQQMDQQMAILDSESVIHRAAVQVEFASRLESQVGKKLDGGKRISGRAKKTKQAQFEVSQLNQYAGRGAA